MVEADYFRREPTVGDEPCTYADQDAATTANLTVEWQHGIGDVVSALTATGLHLKFLHEHDFSLFPSSPPSTSGTRATASRPTGPGSR
ncbi:hypothetical protein ACIRPK_06390 [Kitasatospora sp. NPDC101801]|uniref:hypothetical protein n=1 Tax=Kitasatospora sp. NPDC101801 TaxID=3364103 RepID=UPI00381BFA0E